MKSLVAAWAGEDVEALRARGELRTLEPRSSPQGVVLTLDGNEFLNFSSNDYLGLANDERLKSAAAQAVAKFGVGSGASRLVVGDAVVMHELEQRLATLKQTECAVVFNSGYAANTGAIAALVGADDVVFSDALNHASLVDGCRLSRAKVVVFSHGDVSSLRALLERTPGRRKLVVTDSVFSMDGDVAPLVQLRAACDEFGAALFVDEAHATGVFGPTGAGACEAAGVRADVVMGTLSKALGGFGAFIAGPAALRDVLLSRARPLLFSTALPPLLMSTALTALNVVRDEPVRRATLWRHIERVGRALNLPPASPIFSIVIGGNDAALEASARLRARGVLVKAIRPPTVPEGTSRLRVSLSAAHSDEQVERLIAALRERS